MIRSFLKFGRIREGLAVGLGLLVVFLVNAANAQSSSVAVTASVVAPVSTTLSGGSDGAGTLNFSLVLDGSTGTVNPNTSSSAGLFTVGVGAGMLMNLTFSSPTVTLWDSTGTNWLPFTPQVVGDTLSSNQSAAAALTSGGQITLGSAGYYYIWLGGSVVIPSGQAAGTYTGTFSLTVSY